MNETDIEAAVKQGVMSAVKDLSADAELSKRFWEAGFQHLSKHAGDGASQWIGKRILTAFVAAVVTTGLVWLLKSGYIK